MRLLISRRSRQPVSPDAAGIAQLLGFLEAVHPVVPLQRDDRAFHGLDQQQCEGQRQRQPQQRMHPVGRLVDHLDIEDQRHHQMADDHDHQIGGEIVRAMMMQLLAAGVAAVGDLQEGAKHVSLAAGRALAAQAVPEVGFQASASPMPPSK